MNPSEIITTEDRRLLLQLARNAIQTTAQKGRKLPSVESLSPALREKRGVFVTLWMEGALRGCIGFPYPVKPLGEAVQEASISAAFQDPRFPAVLPEELPKIELEISILTVPRPLQSNQIQLGVHGLIVRKGYRSGLLLPQVAIDYHWDKEEFLQQTCVKAGLSPDSWKEGAEIFGFEAEVFSESDLQNKKQTRSV